MVLAHATLVVATGVFEAWLAQDAQELQHEQLVVSSCFEPTVRGIGGATAAGSADSLD